MPVVASRIGSLPDIVAEGISGYLPAHDDPREWIDAVTKLSDDGEVRRLGEGAWSIWDRDYRPERGLEELERAYRAALAMTNTAR